MIPVRFGIVGIGGYAAEYHEIVQKLRQQVAAKLIAVTEWQPEKFDLEVTRFKNIGVKLYSEFDEMLRQHPDELDFVCLPVGIHWHAIMTKKALLAGCDVICEKPAAATIQEVDEMIAVRNHFRKKVLIGYQEIYSASIQKIKSLVVSGRLGKVKTIKVKGGWPRTRSYYDRNEWAGKLRLNGTWVLDGIANNAMAHYINNMLFLASAEAHTSAQPLSVQAELYRAHEIESYDTAVLKAELDTGTTLLFAASHCTKNETDPEMTMICENGVVVRKYQNGETKIKFYDGTVEKFGDENRDPRSQVFSAAIAMRNNGKAVSYCSLEIARAQTMLINAMHDGCPLIKSIPKLFLKKKSEKPPEAGDYRIFIEDIDNWIEKAYAEEKLFSELNVPWARSNKKFVIKNYRRFPNPARSEPSSE